jgi:exodeoxyribonuclease X
VRTAPTWDLIADHVRADPADTWIAAHNAHVDYRALSRHLPEWQPPGVLDTLRRARKMWPHLSRHTLDALLQHADIDLSAVPGQRHRAAFDAHATALLLLTLVSTLTTWEDLVAMAVPPGLPGAPAAAPAQPTLW